MLGGILSVLIETWQFIIGTGVAQGTDVLCNVFGIVVGSCAYVFWAKSVIKFHGLIKKERI